MNLQAILRRAEEMKKVRKPEEKRPSGNANSMLRGGEQPEDPVPPPGGLGGDGPDDTLTKRPGVGERASVTGVPSAGGVGPGQQLPIKLSSDERKYTLHEALEIFVKGAQLAVAEKEAAEHAQRETDSVDEQATIYARDLLKAAAKLNAEK